MPLKIRLPLLLVTIVTLGTYMPSEARTLQHRACKPSPPDALVQVDFRAVPLETVVRFVSCVTSVRVMFATSTLKRREITVFAAKPVKAREVLPLLRIALRQVGLEAVNKGAFTLIQPRSAQVPSNNLSNSGRYPWRAVLWR